MNINTARNVTVSALALIGLLAFSGCSQESSSEENAAAHGKGRAAVAAPHAAGKSTHVAQAKPAEAEVAPPPVTRSICANCGVVLSVKEVDVEGKGSGVGVIAGGVAGGLIGNQVGQGTGRDLATIAGAVGGAIAGNTIEKKITKTRVYDVTVKMENGEEHLLRQSTVPGVIAGDKVKIEGEQIVRQ